MINKKRLIRLTQQLIRINSENPPGNESGIAKFVSRYLAVAGISSKIYEFKKNRPNVVAVLGGRDLKRSLLITPHLDTVPAGAGWKVAAFSAKIKNNRIYGLGATDCKGNLAAAIEAMQSLKESGVKLDYNLVFAATADEECGSVFGLAPLLDKKILKPDLAVVLDSDDFRIITAQKGLIHLKVKICGLRAHGAYPYRGVNAIDQAADVIRDIRSFKFSRRKNSFLRRPSINVGTIRGGDKVNVVADWCEFELDFRFLPKENTRALIEKLKRVIARRAKKFKIEIDDIQQPFGIRGEHPAVGGLVRAIKKVGVKPRISGSEGATVISFFQQHKIPAVATGFGSSGCCHVVNEYAKINNLYKGAQALEIFLKDYKF